MSGCCGKAIIRGEYRPLNQRLLDYGNEAYADTTTSQRVLLWIFSFFDESKKCPVCKSSFSTMFDWLQKYNLINDPVRCVRVVVEPEPEKNLIYKDLGFTQVPVHMFCDANGKLFDILYEFPDEKWLNNYILPLVQADGKVL